MPALIWLASALATGGFLGFGAAKGTSKLERIAWVTAAGVTIWVFRDQIKGALK